MKDRITAIFMGLCFVLFMFMMLFLWILPFGGLLIAFMIVSRVKYKTKEKTTL